MTTRLSARPEALPSEVFASISTPEPGDSMARKQMMMSYVRTFWRFKWIIVLALVLGLAHGIYSALSETPKYRATLSLLIVPEVSYYAEGSGGMMSYYSWKSIATQHALIQSRSVAERVVDELDLVNRSPLLHIPERKFRNTLLRWLQIGMGWLNPPTNLADLGPNLDIRQQIVANKDHDSLRDKYAEMIRDGLSIKSDDETELVYLSFDSADPEFAKEVVNMVAAAFIAQQEEVQLDRAKRTSKWLTERLTELKANLGQSVKQLQLYRAQESVGDTSSFIELSNSKFQALVSNVTDKRMQLEALSKNYGHKHPKVVAAKQQLAQAEQYLANQTDKIITSRQKEFKLTELEQEVNSNRGLYELFLSELRESDLSTTQSIKDARVIDLAKTPRVPFSPNETKMIGKQIIIAGAWGIGLILLIMFLDNTFRDTEQIEQLLGIPSLGAIPLLSSGDLKTEIVDADGKKKTAKFVPEFYARNMPKSPFAEAVNYIHTSVLYADPDNPPQVVVVSSAVQDEGKTTLSANLATSFSRYGNTLLIDADLRKPGIANLTNVKHLPGLVELIVGKVTKEECIRRERNDTRLSVLHHGLIPPDPLELLSSNSFRKVLDDLKTTFDHIVIDTPPLLPVSDAIVLSHLSNGLILTIEANKTRHWTARLVTKRLIKANVNILGVVLSKQDIRKSCYYSNYDSYYSSYYGKPEKPKPKIVRI